MRNYPCILVGNVGKDPEMRFTPNGAPVTHLRLAVYAGKDQDQKEVTTWVDVTCWGKLAETVNKELNSGDRVQCGGFPVIDQYKKKDKSEGASLKLTAFAVARVPKEMPFEDLVHDNYKTEPVAELVPEDIPV